MLEELSLQDLDPRILKQVENGKRALAQNNANYTIDLCMGILQRFPGCIEVRKLLHSAQKKASPGASGMTRFVKNLTSVPFKPKTAALLKKDPAEALDEVEKAISANPQNAANYKALYDVAAHAELWQTATFAAEEFRRIQPKNVDNLLDLANGYAKVGRSEEAIRTCDEILRIDPSRSDAQDLIKQTAVENTVHSGKWDKEGDYRSKLKDEKEAVSLEQDNRVARDAESLQAIIERDSALLETEPNNLSLYKRLAINLREAGRFEEALNFVAQARRLPAGEIDQTLVDLQHDITLNQFTSEIYYLQQDAEKEPANEELKKSLEEKESALASYKLHHAEEQVERYPNDPQYRFDLGTMYYEEGRYREALQQFQISQKSSKVRAKSLLYIGCTLIADGKYDLATEQLSIAKNEIPNMNDEKKEVIYFLAQAFELGGNEDAAIAEYKTLYSADIGFKDVAEKIDDFYSRN